MNYYNPYFNMYPYMTTNIPKQGIFSRMFGGLKGINFSSILSGTQKTLNVVNQTIPLVRQATPILRNAKTMFRVMNEFKKIDSPKSENYLKKEEQPSKTIESKNISNGPTFFL